MIDNPPARPMGMPVPTGMRSKLVTKPYCRAIAMSEPILNVDGEAYWEQVASPDIVRRLVHLLGATDSETRLGSGMILTKFCESAFLLHIWLLVCCVATSPTPSTFAPPRSSPPTTHELPWSSFMLRSPPPVPPHTICRNLGGVDRGSGWLPSGCVCLLLPSQSLFFAWRRPADGLQERVVDACCRRPRCFRALVGSIERAEPVASVAAMLLLRCLLGALACGVPAAVGFTLSLTCALVP